jgi:hypothetical protein
MLEVFIVMLLIILLSMAWQHLRYLRIRRDFAQDYQRLLHSADVFHVIIYFRLKKGDRVVDTVRRFQQRVVSTNRTRLVYVGQAAFTVHSQQMGRHDWDGLLMLEYPSRLVYQENLSAGHLDNARQCFADSYVHAMRRNRQKNLGTPQLLLRQRLKDILSGKWRVEPLQASPMFATFPEYEIWRTRAARLHALHAINNRGLVVYSLVKRGNRAQQADYADFGREMASRMAALGHGPLHIGRPVALEEFARFDQLLVIQYPSASYYADLLASQFCQRMTGEKVLADTLAVFTIPITDRVMSPYSDATNQTPAAALPIADVREQA